MLLTSAAGLLDPKWFHPPLWWNWRKRPAWRRLIAEHWAYVIEPLFLYLRRSSLFSIYERTTGAVPSGRSAIYLPPSCSRCHSLVTISSSYPLLNGYWWLHNVRRSVCADFIIIVSLDLACKVSSYILHLLTAIWYPGSLFGFCNFIAFSFVLLFASFLPINWREMEAIRISSFNTFKTSFSSCLISRELQEMEAILTERILRWEDIKINDRASH